MEKSNLETEELNQAGSGNIMPEDAGSEETPDSQETESVEILDDEQPDDYKQKYEELNGRLLRQLAEFDNFRKRTAREKSSMYDDGVRDTVTKVLPILDNFERALQSVENQDGFYKGVEMILEQFKNCITELGVEAIPAEGEPFDPNLHYAVGHIEDEKYDDNVVFEELQKGYKYKDKVIRPAMVRVAN